MKRKNEKDHHNRKSEGSAEVWRKQKKARNAARPKQRWIQDEYEEVVDQLISTGGHWERAEQSTN